MSFEKTRYFLQSVKTGNTFPDQGWTLDAPGESDPTLVRAVYEHRQLTLREELPGLYKFADWLPIGRVLEGSSAPVTFRSRGFAQALGLKNLFITFSGWWPEKGAHMTTCSFKETEAFSFRAANTQRASAAALIASERTLRLTAVQSRQPAEAKQAESAALKKTAVLQREQAG